MFRDLENFNDKKLVGDLKKDLEALELICSDRKKWDKTVDKTIYAKPMNLN